MAYNYQNSKGQTYYLHGKEVTLQGGRKQRIHYFAREAKPGEALDDLPGGHSVVENPRTGLPFLKRTEGTAASASKPAAKAATGAAAPASGTRAKATTTSRAKK